MLYLGIFGLECSKTIVIFEISTLEFVNSKFLTHTVNFGTGCAFSKGPFPSPSPLYKACQLSVKRSIINRVISTKTLYSLFMIQWELQLRG